MEIAVSTGFNINTCNDVSNNILVYVSSFKKYTMNIWFPSFNQDGSQSGGDKTFSCPEEKQTLQMSAESPR